MRPASSLFQWNYTNILVLLQLSIIGIPLASSSQPSHPLQIELLSHLLSTELLHCDLVLINNADKCQNAESLFSQTELLYQFHNLPTQILSLPLNNRRIERKPSLRFPRQTLFIIEVSSESSLLEYFDTINQILSPLKPAGSKYIFVPCNITRNPGILEKSVLNDIPEKIEITASSITGSNEEVLMIWGYCEFCPEVTKEFGRSRNGYILVGTYSVSKGYTKKTPLFPDFSRNLFQKPIDVIQIIPNKVCNDEEAYTKLLNDYWYTSPFAIYRLIAEAVLEGINYRIQRPLKILEDLTFGEDNSGEGHIQLQTVLENSTNTAYSTVLFRDSISDLYIQSSVPYMTQNIVMVHLRIKPSLVAPIREFLFSWRWPMLAALVFVTGSAIVLLQRMRTCIFGSVTPMAPIPILKSVKGQLWNLVTIFVQQSTFPSPPSTNLSKLPSSVTLIVWGFFGIFYVWMWKLNILDTFMGGKNLIEINCISDILRINELNDPDNKFKIVTYLQPTMWNSQMAVVSQKMSGSPDSKYYHMMKEVTSFVETSPDCVELVLKHENENYVCIGFEIDLVNILHYFIHHNNHKHLRNATQLEVKPTELGTRYMSLAFPLNFPWIERVNQRIGFVLETGLMERWIGNVLLKPSPGWDSWDKLINEFSMSVDFKFVVLIFNTMIWCALLAVFVWVVELTSILATKSGREKFIICLKTYPRFNLCWIRAKIYRLLKLKDSRDRVVLYNDEHL